MRKENPSPARHPLQWVIQLRESILVALVEYTKPWYAKWFKKGRAAWQHSRQSLLGFPPQTLGHDLGKFLEAEGFNLMPKMEDHDVMHVLLRLQTTVVDEARMQFFLIGNGKRSVYAFFTAAIAICLIPEKIRAFRAAFGRGKKSLNITGWKFEYLLSEPTIVLQQLINKKGLGVEAPLYL